jgi:hypothetical protein
MRNRTTRLTPDTIKRAIMGGGLGTGIGLIGVALMAAGAASVHRPERLLDEVLMLFLGCFAGLTLGWLVGPMGVPQSKLRLRISPALVPCPVPALAYSSPEPLPPIPVRGMPSWVPA